MTMIKTNHHCWLLSLVYIKYDVMVTIKMVTMMAMTMMKTDHYFSLLSLVDIIKMVTVIIMAMMTIMKSSHWKLTIIAGSWETKAGEHSQVNSWASGLAGTLQISSLLMLCQYPHWSANISSLSCQYHYHYDNTRASANIITIMSTKANANIITSSWLSKIIHWPCWPPWCPSTFYSSHSPARNCSHKSFRQSRTPDDDDNEQQSEDSYILHT